MSPEIILGLAAAILAVVALVQSEGRNWLAWAVLFLAAIHLLPALG